MRIRRLDFEIDKLTNSIENVLTNEVFETAIVQVGNEAIPRMRDLGWNFNWVQEFDGLGREIYALVKKKDDSVWHGLVSLSDEHDHIFMHLLENAPFNKGHHKQFEGVAANLVAFVCKTSFEKGYEGIIAFDAKTRFIEHYENTLGAQRFTINRMFINTKNAHRLVKQYFPNFFNHDRL